MNGDLAVPYGPPRECLLKITPDFQGYGFQLHVTKGQMGKFIGEVDAGSPAEAAGLKQGDKVLQVNGKDIAQDTHSQVVQKIRLKRSETTLVVAGENVNNNNDMQNGHGGQPTRMCRIRKEPGFQGFGFSLNWKSAQTGHTVCEVLPGSPAENAGVQLGDKVLMVNGVYISPSKHRQAVELIRRRPDEVDLMVTDPVTTSTVSAPRECHLQMRPDYQGYGFSFRGEKGKDGHIVEDVQVGSPAEHSGLMVNDKVIEVNGENIIQDSHYEAVQKMKSRTNEMILLVVDPATERHYREQNIPISSNRKAHTLPADSPSPRQCELHISPDFQGYGFSFKAEKGRAGHFIEEVQEGSPAEAAGLRVADRIIEVNGDNMKLDNHAQVVQKMRAKPDEVTLLVLDADTEEFYNKQNIVVNHSLPTVMVISSKQVVGNGILEEDAPSPRECHLRLSPDYDGYGFNVAAEQGKAGHVVESVHPGSPAETAGLIKGDHIVEVHGENVAQQTHAQVISKMKADPNSIVVLVVDQETEQYYIDRNIPINSALPNIQVIDALSVSALAPEVVVTEPEEEEELPPPVAEEDVVVEEAPVEEVEEVKEDVVEANEETTAAVEEEAPVEDAVEEAPVEDAVEEAPVEDAVEEAPVEDAVEEAAVVVTAEEEPEVEEAPQEQEPEVQTAEPEAQTADEKNDEEDDVAAEETDKVESDKEDSKEPDAGSFVVVDGVNGVEPEGKSADETNADGDEEFTHL